MRSNLHCAFSGPMERLLKNSSSPDYRTCTTYHDKAPRIKQTLSTTIHWARRSGWNERDQQNSRSKKNTKIDCFLSNTLQKSPRNARDYTQRKMFSLVSTIFDPLWIVSQPTMRIKMLLQQVGKLGKKCDEPLATELHSNLQKVLNNYIATPDVETPRGSNTSTS